MASGGRAPFADIAEETSGRNMLAGPSRHSWRQADRPVRALMRWALFFHAEQLAQPGIIVGLPGLEIVAGERRPVDMAPKIKAGGDGEIFLHVFCDIGAAFVEPAHHRRLVE